VPGKALTFLDAHIKCGNSLIGATPALIRKGIPDAAFKPIEGDDKKFARALEKQNAKEREGQLTLFDAVEESGAVNVGFAQSLRRITAAPSQDLAEVRRQEAAYRDWLDFDEYRYARHIANAWCAAFLWRKTPDAPPAVTYNVLRTMQRSGGTPASPATHEEIERLAEQYRFFHWHLEFPEVFRVPADGAGVDPETGWAGGFDCVLGNPPWERIKLQEQEFFATRDEKIAKAANKAARDRLIKALADSPEPAERALHAEFTAARRVAEGISHLLLDSGRYPLTGRGDVNTYSVFAETASCVIGPHGRFGLVLPTGIATDATTAPFFSSLVRSGRLASFLDFENEAFILSRAVHHSVRFALLTVTGSGERVDQASFAFGTRYIEDLDSRRFTMPPEEILLVNPNTGTLPLFHSRRDAEITLGIYRRMPVLLREEHPDGNPWDLSFMTMFHMSNDSHLFHTREQLEADGWTLRGNIFERGDQQMVPLYEAKMFYIYDHRLGTFEGQTEAQANMGTLPRLTADQQNDPNFLPVSRYWVDNNEVESRLCTRAHNNKWLLGFRNITRNTNERTLIAAALPRTAVGHSAPLILAVDGHLLLSVLTSMVCDYVLRQKLGGVNLTFNYFEQIPVPPRAKLVAHSSFITPRILELTFNANDMIPFARELGDTYSPFLWIEERRLIIRAELDALFFHLYGIARDDVDYIMDTFSLVKRKDETRYGSYRTKELILAEYDRMTSSGVSITKPLIDGDNFVSTLDPPPGHGPRHEITGNTES